ncbi:hypothetical protein VNI00_002290 [Paramarasmius palmivorus]|uniref:Uncharacterized protein n=1 Tax=Paramarasmius palmivorus TaxID=297713 RepID=A0AAW0E492_9AGAR
MDPIPYNVTISSRTASILYSPTRDTSLDKGWNVTYSNGVKDVGWFGKAGVGIGSHSTTTAGATMKLSWVGTAIYLYGESAKATSYGISVDGVDVFGSSPSGSSFEPGLLGLKTGLSYGSHTAELTVVGGDKVRFQHAIVTIGMGYQASTTSIQSRNVYATVPDSSDQLVRNDNFFTFNRAPGSGLDCDWVIGNIYPADILPNPVPRQVITSCGNRSDSVVFRFNQTSAFFLFGTLYFDHQWKTVTMKPGLNGDSSKITQLNDFSYTTDVNQTLHWESGLDRDQEYEVEIVIDENDGKNMMSFHTLELIDG